MQGQSPEEIRDVHKGVLRGFLRGDNAAGDVLLVAVIAFPLPFQPLNRIVKTGKHLNPMTPVHRRRFKEL